FVHGATHAPFRRLQEKLIFSPAEDFFTQLNTEIRNRSSQFMQDQGVNVAFLRRLSRTEFSVRLMHSSVCEVQCSLWRVRVRGAVADGR
ncbi:hypothetical protein, partial [Vibrio cholerae]|uniref:hypothetical protein n=1 Tax=Vibrio cholerae TaxID=666 RepID=UPI001F454523